MSLDSLILFLGIISWLFFVFITAFQVVRPDNKIKLFQYSIPLWLWACGALTSILLIVLYFLDKLSLLLWLQGASISIIYSFFLFLIFLYSILMLFIIQFSWGVENSTITKKRILLSILSGFFASIGFSSLCSSLWVIQVNSTDVDISGLICILIPIQIIATIGTNSQLKWRQKFAEKSKSYYESHLPTDKNKI